MQKIMSWNVASVRARMPALEQVLKTYQPDILFLQEIKATDENFPFMDLATLGYQSFIAGQKAYNGVAILSKEKMELVSDHLPDCDLDYQARFIEIKHANTHYISVYVPNGNPPEKDPADTSRLTYKLKWMDCLTRHIAALIQSGKSVVLGGDFNVIELDTDVYNPEGYRENALMLPVVRDAFQRLTSLPLTHTVRHFNPQEHLYSFWDFQMMAWQKNWGMLLDTIFISNDLLPRLKSSGIYKEVRGWAKTSDHVPVFCVLE